MRRSTVTTYDEGKREKNTAIAEMNRIVEPPVNDRSRWEELSRVEEVVASGPLILSKATTTATARTAKEIGLDWQLKNNKFARASCVFVHFFAVVERLRRATS